MEIPKPDSYSLNTKLSFIIGVVGIMVFLKAMSGDLGHYETSNPTHYFFLAAYGLIALASVLQGNKIFAISATLAFIGFIFLEPFPSMMIGAFGFLIGLPFAMRKKQIFLFGVVSILLLATGYLVYLIATQTQ